MQKTLMLDKLRLVLNKKGAQSYKQCLLVCNDLNSLKLENMSLEYLLKERELLIQIVSKYSLECKVCLQYT